MLQLRCEWFVPKIIRPLLGSFGENHTSAWISGAHWANLNLYWERCNISNVSKRHRRAFCILLHTHPSYLHLVTELVKLISITLPCWSLLKIRLGIPRASIKTMPHLHKNSAWVYHQQSFTIPIGPFRHGKGAWIFQKDLSANPKWWRHFPTLTNEADRWFPMAWFVAWYRNPPGFQKKDLKGCCRPSVFALISHICYLNVCPTKMHPPRHFEWWSCLVSPDDPHKQTKLPRVLDPHRILHVKAVDVSCGFLTQSDQIRFPSQQKKMPWLWEISISYLVPMI